MKKKDITNLKVNYFALGAVTIFFIFAFAWIFFVILPNLEEKPNNVYEKICYSNYWYNETLDEFFEDGTEDCIYQETNKELDLSEAECLVHVCPFGSRFLDGSHVCYDNSKSYGIVEPICKVWKLNDIFVTN